MMINFEQLSYERNKIFCSVFDIFFGRWKPVSERLNGVEILAKHKFQDLLVAEVNVNELNRWHVGKDVQIS